MKISVIQLRFYLHLLGDRLYGDFQSGLKFQFDIPS